MSLASGICRGFSGILSLNSLQNEPLVSCQENAIECQLDMKINKVSERASCRVALASSNQLLPSEEVEGKYIKYRGWQNR